MTLCQANGFLEALNGLFQAAKRRARDFTRMSTTRTAIFLHAARELLPSFAPLIDVQIAALGRVK